MENCLGCQKPFDSFFSTKLKTGFVYLFRDNRCLHCFNEWIDFLCNPEEKNKRWLKIQKENDEFIASGKVEPLFEKDSEAYMCEHGIKWDSMVQTEDEFQNPFKTPERKLSL